MVEFENPAAFFLLLLIPVLFFLRYVQIFQRVSFRAVLGDWGGDYFEWKGVMFNFFSFLVRFFEVIAFIAAIFAYANPVIRHQEKVYVSRGADIVFVVDTSPSMAAKDIAGMSRIEAAKKAIRTLATENSGSCFGLVEMAQEASLVVPPTMDRTFFFDSIDRMQVGGLGDGTAIGTGLSMAVYHLETSKAPKKAIVLITDGENNAGSINPYTAAHLAETKGITLYVLGIGTTGSVPLEYTDPRDGKFHAGYFQSKYDSQYLSRLAASGAGSFFSIETINALTLAFNSINKGESVIQSYRMKNYDTHYYYYFLFVAGILFAFAWFIKRVMLKEIV